MGLINRNRAQPLKNITFSHIMDICTSPTSVKKKTEQKQHSERDERVHCLCCAIYILFSLPS